MTKRTGILTPDLYRPGSRTTKGQANHNQTNRTISHSGLQYSSHKGPFLFAVKQAHKSYTWILSAVRGESQESFVGRYKDYCVLTMGMD